jgi:hypothetical protein
LLGATTTPEVAYQFARGEEVTASNGTKAKLKHPLDFLIVADASENLGFLDQLKQGSPRIVAHEKGKQWHEALKKGGFFEARALADLKRTYAAGKFPPELTLSPQETQAAWQQIVMAADKFNEPGKFSSFIGYEWTGPAPQQAKRVIVFKNNAGKAGQAAPLTAQQADSLEKLYSALAEYEQKTGGSVLTIAESANLSNGQAFANQHSNGKPFDASFIEQRQRYEPLYEITQTKGDSEAHAQLSPNDEFADFETWDQGNFDLSVPTEQAQLRGDYAREGLKTGLALAQTLGKNPFVFGFVGGTASHTGLATADDANFFGENASFEPKKRRLAETLTHGKAGTVKGWQMAASGYCAVWATSNTREAIFEAMQRRETYATTGPRIVVRFFAGWDFSASDLQEDWEESAYERGVPMGGSLGAAPAGRAPSFLVFASKQQDGANLDRVQIVKGWVDAQGETHEKVYDVAWSGTRQQNGEGKLPAVGNTVDLGEATYDNSIGAPELAKVWMDPDFDPKQRAFYYARVLEIPTPRWTAYDVKRFTMWAGGEVPTVTQERAYSSPIWVEPN